MGPQPNTARRATRKPVTIRRGPATVTGTSLAHTPLGNREGERESPKPGDLPSRATRKPSGEGTVATLAPAGPRPPIFVARGWAPSFRAHPRRSPVGHLSPPTGAPHDSRPA